MCEDRFFWWALLNSDDIDYILSQNTFLKPFSKLYTVNKHDIGLIHASFIQPKQRIVNQLCCLYDVILQNLNRERFRNDAM